MGNKPIEILVLKMLISLNRLSVSSAFELLAFIGTKLDFPNGIFFKIVSKNNIVKGFHKKQIAFINHQNHFL